MHAKYLVVVAGPTAAGKTHAAIFLAAALGTEIVSADSRQLYREMSIGTARPEARELQTVKHHFIGTKSVTELYGAGHFAAEARQVLETLFKEHNVVVLVGGSGLYLDALLKGVDDFEEIPPELRARLSAEYQEKGIAWLREQVKKLDPDQYRTMDTENPQRMLRVLEVCVHTGKPYSSFLRNEQQPLPYEVIGILVDPGREELYERINRRVDEMVARGLVQEARALYPLRHHNALKTVGYAELFDHFDGKLSLQQAIEKIKQHTRNYAKRQMTWFRNRGHYTSFHPSQTGNMLSYIHARMDGRTA